MQVFACVACFFSSVHTSLCLCLHTRRCALVHESVFFSAHLEIPSMLVPVRARAHFHPVMYAVFLLWVVLARSHRL